MSTAAAEAPVRRGTIIGVPAEDAFADSNYVDGEGSLGVLASDLIESYSELRHLNNYGVTYLWKKKASMSKGQPVPGTAEVTGGKLRYFAGGTFVVILAADWCRDHPESIEPLLYQQLLKCGEEELEDGDARPRIEPYDFHGFRGEIERYRAWNDGLKLAEDGFRQLRLPLE